MEDLTPLYNKEFYLAYLCGEDVVLPIPDGNTEHYLAYLCGMDVTIPDVPDGRTETYLAYKCGEDVVLPDPMYRIEFYLAKWCGVDCEVPEPMYRIEYWLAQLANSGELKTVIGNPISVSDALAKPAESLSIEILPSQDLHGYDNPWPAGGGKNKFNKDTLSQANEYDNLASGYRYCDTIILKPNTQYTISPTSRASLGVSDYYVLYINPDASDTDYLVITNADIRYVVYAGTPNTVTFTTGATGAIRFSVITQGSGIKEDALSAFMSIDYQLEEGSTATSWVPYENLCPISGHESVKVTRTGKNLCPINIMRTSHNGIDYTVTTEGIRVHGTATSGAYSWTGGINTYEATWLKVPAGTYTFSITDMFGTNQNDGYVVFMGFDIDGTAVSYVTLHDGNRSITRTYTKPVGLYYGIYVKSGLTVDTVVKIQFELGSTATAYEPYTGTTYSISWQDEAGTVYGGSLDVTTGVLTVTQASITKNTADMDNGEDWPGWKNSGVRSLVGAGINGAVPNAFSNISPVITSGDRAILVNTLNNLDILLLNKAYFNKTQSEWIALAMDVQIVVPLATPLTYQLTPTQVDMLLGNNTIWNDVDGDMTLEYLADGPADDVDALQILLNNRYVNNGAEDEATDKEALEILLGGNTR